MQRQQSSKIPLGGVLYYMCFIFYCYLTEVAARFEILDVSFFFFSKLHCNFMADVFKP